MTPAPTPASMPLADAVRAQQVRLLYANGFQLLATLFAAAVLSGLFIYLGVLKPWVAGVWLAVMASHITVRLGIRAAYQRSATQETRWRAWARRFTIGAAVAGGTWGLGAVAIMPPGRFDLQMIVILTISSIVYATLAAFGSWFPAFMVFTVCALLPPAVWSLLQGDAAHLAFALLCVIWAPAIVVLARRHEASLSRAFTLQFENAALAEDLRGQKQVAELASVAKSRFLASASHDLRQPVHALGMLVGALRSHQLPQRSVALIDHLDSSIGALDSLFTSLLDISRLDAGVVEGRMAAVPLAPLIGRILRDLSDAAAAKGLTLTAAPTSAAVVSDPILLERILRNLIGNAVLYTEEGRILVGVRRRAGRLAIEVWDSGPGIAPDQQEAVFEEFYQLENPDRDRAKGLGLGLAIVRRLTAILGHRLSLESRPGRGSVFRIEAERAAWRAAIGGPAEPAPAAVGAGVILAIDDESQIRVAMAELLRSWGHEVIVAAGGEEALAALAGRAAPDLILCDYRLRGGESGVKVIRRLQRALGTQVPAILMTGDTAADRIREAQASGFPLLHKPVPHARLRAAVTSQLRRRRDAPAPAAG
ncbi:hybrid sensor histidine kinase/response regulator [Phenylobacterium sp.]|uniref:ATP-binding response regulator n=1 Tax=Phenylobacterium sp. TaxID=1871053 RepID=UPI00121D9834|nr:hybrid sensor histidine kinase/response regulator [Phenylobacterium sp.]THD64113.1 MAG: hybrid sensor histidine kinase/response regulator [Phenylobacterium sp.]